MAQREINWTPRALRNKFDILDFWYNHNQSTVYSLKLERLFNTAVKHAARAPEAGRPFDVPRNIRYVIIRNFRLYYVYSNSRLTVLSIWDSRRNPKGFKL
ncbi:type II toxin-antitoxin system RelE/ParE family toxin [Owenweeksia hongkongensis]|uniref:type II toxin-antitoxin system RelE/ParE family toxin n=1 Tax=Owenweeksia hongkongensis TaxID=253245 RepID=UPI003A8DC9CE